uniref:Uncharacterized protein n=1 Tax=viral metagenome TaxID=1070528 RepID=A0A6C0EBG8_9ZZZZ
MEEELGKVIECLYGSIPNHVFYYCADHCIVFEKLSDTMTDENRENVVDKNYALFHANKLKIIKIFNLDTFEHKNQIGDYECNTIIERSDISLPYYVKIETVINLSSRSKINGFHKDYYESGSLKSCCTYRNGKKFGKYCEFYDEIHTRGGEEQEYLRLKCTYDEEEKLHKSYTKYYINQKISFRCQYRHGVKNQVREFDENQILTASYKYVNEVLHGTCYKYDNGVIAKIIYDNGTLLIQSEIFFTNV